MENLQIDIARKLPDGEYAKPFFFCGLDSVHALSDAIKPDSVNFGIFLAIDARQLDNGTLRRIGASLIGKGLALLCACRPDCVRVEREFDAVAVRTAFDRGIEITQNNVLMTTSHADESLSEALWFFSYAAAPARDYQSSCKDWVIAAIGNSGWVHEVRTEAVRVLENIDA